LGAQVVARGTVVHSGIRNDTSLGLDVEVHFVGGDEHRSRTYAQLTRSLKRSGLFVDNHFLCFKAQVAQTDPGFLIAVNAMVGIERKARRLDLKFDRGRASDSKPAQQQG
jgi:hypothetical protein